ncbi:hypothetical protein [Paraglaciecola aestuariivivens]
MKYVIMGLTLLFGSASLEAQEAIDPTKPDLTSLVKNDKNNQLSMQKNQQLKLTAIINSEQQILAIINGKSVVQGQQIDGYEVLSISQNHVIIDGLEGKQTLYVNNNNVKKDTTNGY